MLWIARILLPALVYLSLPAGADLKKGDPFYPFRLVSVDDVIVTVKLDGGKLAVIKENTATGAKTVTYPKAVLIDFWATWCVPCRAAMPSLQSFHERFRPPPGRGEGGLELFGIALDQRGAAVVKPFLERLPFTYTMLADPGGGPDAEGLLRTAKEMSDRYDTPVIPAAFLINAAGKIVHIHIGFNKSKIDSLEKAIAEAVRDL